MTHRVYKMSFASVYPHYVAKAEKKGRTKAEVDEVIRWLTGYSAEQLDAVLEDRTDFENFFGQAPALNPARASITGTICGVRIEEIEDPLMREIMTVLPCLGDRGARGHPRQADRRAGEGQAHDQNPSSGGRHGVNP